MCGVVLVLIVLWILASAEDPAYIPVAVNFAVFLFNELNMYKKHDKNYSIIAVKIAMEIFDFYDFVC